MIRGVNPKSIIICFKDKAWGSVDFCKHISEIEK